ncbi:glycoside hydrolase family 19 protein [Dactylosporangium sp. CA-233914]|uniref:glycoside hydrolase family 19 protein n=1 Tax=Dactylosporangium sp. CA-233914 TaxID=3239934 RepID=UPI003D8EA98D
MDRSRLARLRRVLGAAAAAVLGILVLIPFSPGTAAAAGTGAITGYGGKCVDVSNANTANGTTVQLWTCNGTGAQSWTVGTDGTIRALGKCLDVSGGSTADGARVQLWDCNGTGAQQWVVSAANDIVNPQANKCLDAAGWGSTDGTPLLIWSCHGGANQKWTAPSGGTGSCSYPNWVAGQWYAVGAIVRYTNGLYYQATHENPGYDPTISTWFWSPYNCGGGGGGGGTTGFVVSEAQFNQMFPSRNGFYTYAGLTDAMKKYPAFATTGSDTVKRQEAAAFLANVSHETGGLVYINEINTANWPHYCDTSQPYGCPAGQSAYHGRGPIQLSWNFNYKAAGDALGVDLLNNPDLVATNSSISWQTGLWYWMTGTGNAGTTSHNAMVNGQGFGTTIRAINSIECNGGNPAQVQSRVNLYNQFVAILGVPAGGNLTC